MRLRRQSGMNAVELSLAIPIILAMIYGMFYTTMTLISKSALTSTATDTLKVVITDPSFEDLSYPYPSCDAELSSDYCRRKSELVASLKKRLESSFISSDGENSSFVSLIGEPEIELPAVESGETLTQAYERRPIVIRVKAEVSPFLPGLAPIQIEGIASGFRELHDATSYQVITNCKGVPFDDPAFEDSSQECVCKDEGKGLYLNAEGKTVCKACPTYAVPLYNNIPGTEGYIESTSTIDGCACPTKSECKRLAGPRARAGNCSCYCHPADGQWQGDQCVCSSNFDIYNRGDSNMLTAENRTIAGNGHTVTFSLEKTSSCGCQVESRSGPDGFSSKTGNLDPNDCALMYGGDAASYGTNYGCGCLCRVCGGNGNDINGIDHRFVFNTLDTCTQERCRCNRNGRHKSIQEAYSKGKMGGLGVGFDCKCRTDLSEDEFKERFEERQQICVDSSKNGVNKFLDENDCTCKTCDVGEVQKTCPGGYAVDPKTCSCTVCTLGYRVNEEGGCVPLVEGEIQDG